MLATFVLTEPVLLVAALAVLAGVVSASRARGWFVGVTAGVLALGFGVLLKAIGTPAAHGILLGAAAAAAVSACVVSYRAGAAKLSRSRAAVCVAARSLAWLVALVLIGRPCWDSLTVEWEKPLLAVLLDQSRSMSIVDSETPDDPSRAAIANAAFAGSAARIADLDRLYEVQAIGVGEDAESISRWSITPRAPVTPLAAAIRRAARSRSTRGEPPVGVLVFSDGAENAASAQVVREAASELAAQQTPLIALGVGPAAQKAPAVFLEPLSVPASIGSRDRLRVPLRATIEGCAGHKVDLKILWGDEQAEQQTAGIEKDPQAVSAEFEVRPPAVGLQRLTARVKLPEELGGETFETSTMVDVSDDRIRVLILEGRPRNESAFAVRALRGDPRFDVTQQLALAEDSRAAAAETPWRWADYDVVILGRVPAERLGFGTLRDLADAVRERGVGLLMVGGDELFYDSRYVDSDLQDVSPVELRASRRDVGDAALFTPTAEGLRHPVLLGVGANDEQVWKRLPPPGKNVRFGELKDLATVLATDGAGRPLLVAHDVGRGRAIAAAWESTWIWALASDAGAELHGRLWRQMAAWLANKRPTAWVVTDRSSYVRDALKTGRQTLLIRAGLSRLETTPTDAPAAEYEASLTMRRVSTGEATETPTEPTEWTIPLRREGAEWRAALPGALAAQSWSAGGEYELEFTVLRSGEAGGMPEPLKAQTGFVVLASDLELTEPTSNLALLREAALRTVQAGGAYQPIQELPEVLRALLANDRRRRVEHRARFDIVERAPWLLLALAVAALTCEWASRKRGGLN